jgi:SanA protein
MDYAGLRTLDSIVRCKEIFGQSKITIITQPFHSYRALFISKLLRNASSCFGGRRTQYGKALPVYVREYLARTKAILDLYVLGTTPRHLGNKEPIAV